MKSKLIASLSVASFIFAVAPAFASGYGPAPSYTPGVGAPASQRGPSLMTIEVQHDKTGATAYGGTADVHAQSGASAAVDKRTTAFTYH